MMKYWLRAAIFCLLCASGPAYAQDIPEDNDLYVNDYAQLLTNSEEQLLRETLEELWKARGVEFTVLTINKMSDYGHDGEIEPFATRLFNAWGIGHVTRNDGVLLLVSRDDQKVRIEVGSGYGNRLNAPMQRVIDRTVLPKFRNGNYVDGIFDGVNETIFEVTGRYPGQFNLTDEEIARAQKRETTKTILEIIGVLSLVVFVPAAPFLLIYVIYRIYKYRKRRAPRFCPNDGTRMRRYLEETEDAKMSPGQIDEERLASVEHDVWYCDNCDHIRVDSYNIWKSNLGACRECGFRTVEGESTIVSHATYSSSGKCKTDYSCLHCEADYTVWSTIPKRVRQTSSSSSRSSSRSRGGGRSSGGGASGSW
ncbi:hypothetical protein DS901_17795 [Loktanella sp. D2R18]|uniref:TPM domain-containing protein n=1 Tax=Rhodobacterales TaxID=204455 RepID=UPI000DE8B8EF|nr:MULTISPECIES: TPM domain-containing protein [Rhodobacterales]MDO6590449.1 TPM domain-containing protein [Yoonia sp. 1_MG-2023]RBW41171.1 hypothetical protein DS901_17795 [Loktanella sp. D2R18]